MSTNHTYNWVDTPRKDESKPPIKYLVETVLLVVRENVRDERDKFTECTHTNTNGKSIMTLLRVTSSVTVTGGVIG